MPVQTIQAANCYDDKEFQKHMKALKTELGITDEVVSSTTAAAVDMSFDEAMAQLKELLEKEFSCTFPAPPPALNEVSLSPSEKKKLKRQAQKLRASSSMATTAAAAAPHHNMKIVRSSEETRDKISEASKEIKDLQKKFIQTSDIAVMKELVDKLEKALEEFDYSLWVEDLIEEVFPMLKHLSSCKVPAVFTDDIFNIYKFFSSDPKIWKWAKDSGKISELLKHLLENTHLTESQKSLLKKNSLTSMKTDFLIKKSRAFQTY